MKKQPDRPRMILKGHTGSVHGVAVTPDGKTIVSGSSDKTLKVWDLETGRCRATLEGHANSVLRVALTPDGKTVVSGSADETAKVWNLETGKWRATLKGHFHYVWGLAVTPDARTFVSGAGDRTLRVWDLKTGESRRTLTGHTANILAVAITPDGRTIVSGSVDKTLKVWDLDTGRCCATFEGHGSTVCGLAVVADGKRVVSASGDKTLKVWDLETAHCRATFEGHTNAVRGVAVTPDGKTIVSGSDDNTLRVWDLETGTCRATLKGHTNWVWGVAVTPDGNTVVSCSADNTLRVWDLPEPEKAAAAPPTPRYTNAKVVLCGDTGVGKTGLAIRLTEDTWRTTESTHGMQVSKLDLAHAPGDPNLEREIWLWDFAGQPDYRLIHQLFMDETALGLIVFNPQDDNPFEGLAHWDKALRAAVKHSPEKLLVAGRCDRGGTIISKAKLDRFRDELGFAELLNTGAKTGEGCDALKAAIARYIPWDRLPWTATTQLFKTLKDAIIGLKGEGTALMRLSELRQRLQLILPEEAFKEEELRAVVGLLQGQGLIQKLDFGDLVLLQPELVNQYASVVVRCAREHAGEMGTVSERDVLEAALDFKGVERLDDEADERILLRAITQILLDRSLCLREDTAVGPQLVFPAYFNRDKPDPPEHPNIFVTYGFEGKLDEIYSTLVVRLSYSDGFEKDELWKNAADFRTHEGKRVGLAMAKKKEGAARITAYFEKGVPDDTRVTFIKYIHEHLLSRAEDVTRVRTYVCPHCDTAVENKRAIQIRLERGLTDILCTLCEKRVELIDLIEEKFASDEFLQRVRELDERARINIDNESRELILVGHAFVIAGEAGQIFRPTPNSDWGLDGEIEFKDRKGCPHGQRVYLQLKSGDSYLHTRKSDDKEIFRIKKPRHATYWQEQAYPVMLVIRTSDGEIRWMNVTEYLKKHGKNVKQIEFDGEAFTAANLVKLRDQMTQAAR